MNELWFRCMKCGAGHGQHYIAGERTWRKSEIDNAWEHNCTDGKWHHAPPMWGAAMSPALREMVGAQRVLRDYIQTLERALPAEWVMFTDWAAEVGAIRIYERLDDPSVQAPAHSAQAKITERPPRAGDLLAERHMDYLDLLSARNPSEVARHHMEALIGGLVRVSA